MKKRKAKAGKLAKARAAVEREQKKKAARKPAQIVEHNGLMTIEQAKHHAMDGRNLAERVTNDFWALGFHAKDGIEHGAPEVLGLSVTAWYQNLYRGAWQSVRKAVEHIKRLKGVPIEELREIPDCNASRMHLLPENLRTTKHWLDLAKNETGEAFTEAVYAKRAELGIQDEAMVKVDSAFKIKSIPASLAPLMQDCLKHAAAANELDLATKEGRISALEVVVSEYHQNHCVEVPEEAGA